MGKNIGEVKKVPKVIVYTIRESITGCENLRIKTQGREVKKIEKREIKPIKDGGKIVQMTKKENDTV